MPHNSLKEQNLFDVVTKSLTNSSSIYILQCSAPYENIIKNNDPVSNSYDGEYVENLIKM